MQNAIFWFNTTVYKTGNVKHVFELFSQITYINLVMNTAHAGPIKMDGRTNIEEYAYILKGLDVLELDSHNLQNVTLHCKKTNPSKVG